MNIWRIFIVLIACFYVPQTVLAASSDGNKKSQAGVVSCGGNHAFSNKNGQAHRSIYVLRNLDNTQAISINRLRVYAANGSILADIDGGALPLFRNEILGPDDNILQPHESAQLRSSELFGDTNFNRRLRPFQFLVDWSSVEDAITLNVSHVRQVNSAYKVFDPTTGTSQLVIGPEVSRTGRSCRTIKM